MSSYFPNRWPLSYLNLTKNMKTYIRRQQHKKKYTPRHKTKRTTTEVEVQQKRILLVLRKFNERIIVGMCIYVITFKYVHVSFLCRLNKILKTHLFSEMSVIVAYFYHYQILKKKNYCTPVSKIEMLRFF